MTEETIKLKCCKCGQGFERPLKYKIWNDKSPNVFWKWRLAYCNNCLKNKEDEALEVLPEVIKAMYVLYCVLCVVL